MGCQREIAEKIADKGADYVLALKGNQGTLRDDAELFFTEQAARGFADTLVSRHETVEKSRGRIESRIAAAAEDAAWLKERHGWPGLASIVTVESVCGIGVRGGARIERGRRFSIAAAADADADAVALGAAIRSHWSIGNGLHRVMDMAFRDDGCRIRTNNAPANFATVKHMASNLLRRAPGKDSLRVRRRLAACDDDFLASLVPR